MTKTFNCPKCSKNTLEIHQEQNKLIGTCSNCGYKYLKEQPRQNNDILLLTLSTLREWAFVIAFISILLIAIISAQLYAQDSTLNTRITTITDDILDDISTINSDIVGLDGDIITQQTIIDNLLIRLNKAEGNITQLRQLHNDTQLLITDINSTLSNLQSFLDQQYTTNVTYTLTTNTTNYSHISINVTSPINLSEIEIYLHYPNSTISTLSSTSYYIEEV